MVWMKSVSEVYYIIVQKRHRLHREVMMENMSRKFSEHAKTLSDLAVDFRKIFVSELFGLALKQVSLSLL
jgi:ent-kaurene oxidase